MPARSTLTDVARRAGVHTSTASRALADHYSIPDETRARVKEAAGALGYHIDPLTAALMKARRQGRPPPHRANLAFIVAESRKSAWHPNAWVHEVYTGAKEHAAASGYTIDVFWTSDTDASARVFDRVLRARNIQGLILSPEHEAPFRFNLDWANFAVISLHYGPSLVLPRFHQIVSNHFHSMLHVYRHCLDLGYQRIGLVLRDHPEFHFEYGRIVLGAYQAASHGQGMSNHVSPLVVRELNHSMIADWVHDNRVDAVIMAGGGFSTTFTVADLSAALRSHGCEVGRDLGMVIMGRRPEPCFASVDERTHKIGARAAELLISMLQQNQRGIPCDPIIHQLDGCFSGGLSLPNRARLVRRVPNMLSVDSVPA